MATPSAPSACVAQKSCPSSSPRTRVSPSQGCSGSLFARHPWWGFLVFCSPAVLTPILRSCRKCAMDFAETCVKHRMRFYVCHQMRLYVCQQMRLCHQMRLYVHTFSTHAKSRLMELAPLASGTCGPTVAPAVPPTFFSTLLFGFLCKFDSCVGLILV